jgi:pyruvate formate lyase activating enzyme
VIVRYPLIPGVNDGPGELAAAAAIVKGLGLPRIDVLPYHRTGMDKYRRLGRSYGLAGVAVPSVGDLDRAAEPFRGAGLSVSIGGGR